MSAQAYLLAVTIKNFIKQLRYQPSKLVALLLAAFSMVLVMVSSISTDSTSIPPQAGSMLWVGLYALLVVTFLVTATNGLSSGRSSYCMADVGLLFPSPIQPVRVLFYGLVKQLGTLLFMAMILIFQFGWMNSSLGVTLPQMLLIMACFLISLLCGHLTAMVLYAYCSGSPRRQRIAMAVLIAITSLSVLRIILPVLTGPKDQMLTIAMTAAKAPELMLFPGGGWAAAVYRGITQGNMLWLAAGSAAIVLYLVALIVILVVSRPDFYEDVLQSTETREAALAAKRGGKMVELAPQKVKAGKIGLHRGQGAWTFFYKHQLEDRRARVFILDTMSLIFMAITIVFTIVIPDVNMVGPIAMSVYIQVFTISTGRWNRELEKPFVYLIPQSSFKKMIGIALQSLLKAFVMAVGIFVPVGIILNAPWIQVVSAIFIYVNFGTLGIACSFFIERIMGKTTVRVFTTFMYFLLFAVFSAPGLAGGIVLAMILANGNFTVQLAVFSAVLTIWNVAVSSLITFLCRDMLHNADFAG